MHVSARLKRRAAAAAAALGEALGLRALTARVREDPSDIGRYYQRCCRLLQLKLYAEAARDADACLKLQPSFAKAHFAKGRALYFLQEYEAAFAQYDAGLKVEANPTIDAWLRGERRRPEYARTTALGPRRLLQRVEAAIRANDAQLLALLLGRCPAQMLDGEPLDDGTAPPQPPLHLAAAGGHEDCVVLLLQRGRRPTGARPPRADGVDARARARPRRLRARAAAPRR